MALPPREYELLLCLMRNKGQVLRREQLLDKVWGIDFEGGDRAVDGRIKVLRAALGPAGKTDQDGLQGRLQAGGGAAWGGLDGCSKGRFQCFQPSGLG